MINVGGAKPGETSMSAFGHRGRYTYFTGEYEEASPGRSIRWRGSPSEFETFLDRTRCQVTKGLQAANVRKV